MLAETGGMKPGRLPRHTARARRALLPRGRCTSPLCGVVVLLAALVTDVTAAEALAGGAADIAEQAVA